MEAMAAQRQRHEERFRSSTEPSTLALHRNPSLAFRHPSMRRPDPQPHSHHDDLTAAMQVDEPPAFDVVTSAQVMSRGDSEFQSVLSRAACQPKRLFTQCVLRVRYILRQPFQRRLRELLDCEQVRSVAPRKHLQQWLLMSDVTGVEELF